MKPSLARKEAARFRREVFAKRVIGLSPEEQRIEADKFYTCGSADLQTNLSIARTVDRFVAKRRKTEEASDKQAILDYHNGIGKTMVEKMVAVDAVACRGQSYRVVPLSPRVPCFEPAPDTRKAVADMISWAGTAKKTSLAPSLETLWDYCNAMIKDDVGPKISDSALKECKRSHALCHAYNMAVCCGVGLHTGNIM